MKKNNQNRYDDFSSVNSELGSFGLEPPKNYRKNQNVKANKAKNSKKNKKSKQKKKRKASKLLTKIISSICIIVSIVAIVVILCLFVFFKIDTIKIVNNEKYTTAQIEAVLPIEKEKSLFLIDTESASQKLEENLPYIYDVQIKRKLPSTVVVTVTETPQVYCVKNPDDTYVLVDDGLKVLEASATELPENTIEIKELAFSSVAIGQRAIIDDDNIYKCIVKLIDSVKRLKLGEATAIYSVDANNNYIEYDSRITIKLGTTEDLDNKLYSALTAINKLNESDPRAEGELTATNVKQVYFTDK